MTALARTLLAAALALGAPAAARAAPQDSVTVILLGTGTPAPDPARQGPAVAVTVGARIFLFDAGPGVVRQMAAAGLPVRGGPVTRLFLTHLHSDHTLGYPDLIFTSWVMGRRTPLQVVGPPGTRAMTRHLLEAWAEDIRVRTEGLEQEPADGYQVQVRETRDGIAYDSANVRVTAFQVPHGTMPVSLAYRLQTPGATIVISGDTRPSPVLETMAAGADLLLHEVYPESRVAPEPRPGGQHWPEYLRTFHTSDRQLGALARRAAPGVLILYHVVRMGATDAELMAGVRAGGFEGRVVLGKDLQRFTVAGHTTID
ncbi:MAG: MBL fold metallo-hydrolase [Gemmatimonadales bacterium]